MPSKPIQARNKNEKKLKKRLTFGLICGILYPVMRDKTNEIVNPIDNGQVITSEVLVSCCGCNEEVRITRDEANEWTDTDWFMCHECE